jgi:hypothetical protein
LVPLSEEEQRILYEIERSFYEQDPESAEKFRSETVYTHAGRHIKWAALGFFVGLGVVIAFFTTNTAIAVGGFLVMLASGVLIQRNFRRMGRAGLADLAAATREHRLTGVVNDVREKFRHRFRSED